MHPRRLMRRALLWVFAAALAAPWGNEASWTWAQEMRPSHPLPEVWYRSQRVTPTATPNSAIPAPTVRVIETPRPVERFPSSTDHPPRATVDAAVRPPDQSWSLAPSAQPSKNIPQEHPLRQPARIRSDASDALPPANSPALSSVLPGPDDAALDRPTTYPFATEATSPAADSVSHASHWRNLAPPQEPASPPAIIAGGTAEEPSPAPAVDDPSTIAKTRYEAPVPTDAPAPQYVPATAPPTTPYHEPPSGTSFVVNAVFFLGGAFVGPMILALALVRWFRASGQPLFRVEIVNPTLGEGALTWASSKPEPRFASMAEEPPPGESPVGRRGAVSSEPPPLELPVEETFEARRRREQEQQSQQEQEILKQLFEDNLEFRRQLGDE